MSFASIGSRWRPKLLDVQFLVIFATLAICAVIGTSTVADFTVATGEEAALKLVARTRLFTLAESLGAVESLIEHPHRMTHSSVADSPLQVDPGLLRLSVGLETVGDLVEDLMEALGEA